MEPDVIARCYDKLRSEDWSVEIGRLPSFRIGRKPCDISFSGATIPEVVASVEKVGDAWELTPYASQFLEVNGVGKTKAEKYGALFLAVIDRHRKG